MADDKQDRATVTVEDGLCETQAVLELVTFVPNLPSAGNTVLF